MKKIILICLMLVSQVNSIEFFKSDEGGMPSGAGHPIFEDFNGDGYKDIYFTGASIIEPNIWSPPPPPTYYLREPARIWINNRQGGFKEKNITDTVYWGHVLDSVLDIDNDGDKDIFSWRGYTLLNDGNANFIMSNVFGLDGFGALHSKDLDNDGISEILMSGKVYKLTNYDPLQYERVSDENSWDPDKSIVFADFNNDQYLDVLAYDESSEIEILLNDGQGNISENNKLQLPYIVPLKLIEGDIDNDGDIDILLSENRLLINNLEDGFQLQELLSDLSIQNFHQIQNYLPIKIFNFNDDEYMDIYLTIETTNYGIQNIVFLGKSDGFSSLELLVDHIIIFGEVNFLEDFNADDFDDILFSSDNLVAFDDSGYLTNYHVLEHFVNPIVNLYSSDYSEPWLHINNKVNKNSSVYTSISGSSAIRFSRPSLADVNNDGLNELIYSSYSSASVYDFIYYNTLYYNTPSYYISDINPDGYKINEFDFLTESKTNFYSYLKPVDFNNDGLDDLITTYNVCNSDECETEQRVLLNTTDGFSENNYISLEAVEENLYDAAQADINGDGYIDFISKSSNYNDTGIIEVYINDSFGLDIEQVMIPEINSPITHIVDFNNDGKDDLFFIDNDSRLQAIFGSSDLNSLQLQQVIDIEMNSVGFYDYDMDGSLDVFSIENNDRKLYIRKYVNGDFDSVIIQQNISFGSVRFMIVEDMDNDNVAEIIINGTNIYQADESGVYSLIKELEIGSNTIYSVQDIIISDLDGDSLKDIVFRNHIFLARGFLFQTGLNYDPGHNGHGFSIENVGEDQFYTVFYTYGSDKYPEWYADLGMFEEPQEDYWNIADDEMGVVKYEYDYDAQTAVHVTDTSYTGYLAHNKCSDTYGDINFSYGIGEGHPGIPVESGEWCSKPIVGYYQRPKNNLSGLWWAGSEDSGWGWSVSLVERENTTDMVVVLYYYDGEGRPRWLIGQQSGFEIGHEITLNMNMVKGYGRSSTPRDLEFIPAGTMSLTLNQASHNLSTAGSMSVDVTYPGPEGGSWVRDNIPIALFSKPRR